MYSNSDLQSDLRILGIEESENITIKFVTEKYKKAAKEKHPVKETAIEVITAIPGHVPYLLIGAGTASFAAYRAIKSKCVISFNIGYTFIFLQGSSCKNTYCWGRGSLAIHETTSFKGTMVHE